MRAVCRSGYLRENGVYGALIAIEVRLAIVQAGVNPLCEGQHIIQR